MRLRVMLHEKCTDRIYIGASFESTDIHENVSEVGTEMLFHLCKNRDMSKDEIGDYWKRISLVDATSLQEVSVMHHTGIEDCL